MSKDWNVARSQLKDALEKQEEALRFHRDVALAALKKAKSEITSETPEAYGKTLDEQILRETIRVQSLERNIRDIQRDLRGKYSLAIQ